MHHRGSIVLERWLKKLARISGHGASQTDFHYKALTGYLLSISSVG